MSRRRQRRSSNSSNKRYELGWVGLFLAATVSFIVASFLRDAEGLAYGFVGGFVWLVFLLFAFFLTLVYLAQFVVPLEEEITWSDSIDLILRHYMMRGKLFFANLFTPKPDIKEESPLPASFKKLQVGFVPSHNALPVLRGNGFSRAAGPGFVVLYKGEQVKEIVDLRPHVRSQPIRFITRDGIPVESTVGVTFQVRQPSEIQENDRRPYPYDPNAIFNVIYFYSLSDEQATQLWSEQVCPRAAALVVEQLSRHTLDEMYHSEQNGRILLRQIGEDVKQALQGTLAAQGINLIGVGVGHLQPPDPVKEQALRSWQTAWERKIAVQEGFGRAEALRRIKRRRARAQIEIINNILESIDTMRQVEDATLSEIIMLRMIEVLEDTAQDTTAHKLFPEPTISKLVLDATSEMRQLLEGPKAADGKEKKDT